MSSLLGTTLSGRYRLDARIGAGGMATVYRAFDQTLERLVAVKLMKAEVASDSDQLERFRREARAVAQLSHPNVVGVIDAGDDDGRPYIVFEYVEGETLKQRIFREGALPIAAALGYAIGVARALAAAHARHIVHRDVKPQNVLIDARGTPKVTDFGIARTLDERGLTDDGRVLGTTDYVSPEQALGREVTAQSDLYSLGIVLYEMLTGELPFSAEAQVAVAVKHVHEPLPDLRAKRPEVAPTLAALVRRVTAKRPEDRYPSDQALIADLERELARAHSRPAAQDTVEVTAELDAVEDSPRSPRREPPGGGKPRAGRRGPRFGDEPGPDGAHHRRRLLALLAPALLVAAGIVAALLLVHSPRPGGHRGGANHPPVLPAQIHLCASCASAYNPDGFGGTGPARVAQNNASAPLAVDGNPASAWETERYNNGQLNKAGVGIYVTVPRATRAVRLQLITATAGFKARVYGSARQPDAYSFPASGWRPLSGTFTAAPTSNIRLASSAGPLRHYLLWITQLPPGGNYAAVNEIKLYRR